MLICKVIFWIYLGVVGLVFWLMLLGVFLVLVLLVLDVIGSVCEVGNWLYFGFGIFIVLIVVLVLVGIMVVNCYGVMFISFSVIDVFCKVILIFNLCVIGIGVIVLVVFGVVLLILESYLGSFNIFVLLMLYFLVFWIVVNLVDFYFVCNGYYVISEIFNFEGIYGYWG